MQSAVIISITGIGSETATKEVSNATDQEIGFIPTLPSYLNNQET